MPRKTATKNDELTADIDTEDIKDIDNEEDTGEDNKDEVAHLNGLLASVLTYLSDDDVEVIDIDYLLTNTEGLQAWWDEYRASNRKLIEEDIKKSLADLSLEDLESIHEKIKGS